MIVIFPIILALLNLGASIVFCLARNWPWALTYFGGFLILVGQTWAIVKDM